jgi:hypothetical protein
MEHLHTLDLERQPVQLLRVRPVAYHVVKLVLVQGDPASHRLYKQRQCYEKQVNAETPNYPNKLGCRRSKLLGGFILILHE